jgi:hypothetical protein
VSFFDAPCRASGAIIPGYVQLSHCKRRRLTALPSPPNGRSRMLRVHKFAMSALPLKSTDCCIGAK